MTTRSLENEPRKSERIQIPEASDPEAMTCDMELIWTSADYPDSKKDVHLHDCFTPIDPERFERRVKESSSARAMWRKDGRYAVAWIGEMELKEMLRLLQFSP